MKFTIDVEPANEVWLDLFPAKITTDPDPWANFQPAHEEYRIIVTDTYFYIIDDTDDGPTAYTFPTVVFEGNNKLGYTVTTPDSTFHITRAPNCGCGSRIRGLRPFAGVPQTRPK